MGDVSGKGVRRREGGQVKEGRGVGRRRGGGG